MKYEAIQVSTRQTRAVSLICAGLLGLAACQADQANAPTALESPSPEAVASLAALRPGLDDAAERLAPALDDVSPTQLASHLRHLSAALAAGDMVQAGTALAGARAILGHGAETPSGAAALVLDRAEILLPKH